MLKQFHFKFIFLIFGLFMFLCSCENEGRPRNVVDIAGTISDSQGQPIVGAKVELLNVKIGWYSSEEYKVDNIFTDNEGSYSVFYDCDEDRYNGSWRIRVTRYTYKEIYFKNMLDGEDRRIRCDRTQQIYNFTMENE